MAKDLNGRVQSVDRAMTLLEVLGAEERGYRLTDLSRKTGLSLTTVHRLLTTLEQRQFVQFSPGDNHWHVGLGAFTVGSAFLLDRNFVAAAGPFLRRLRDQTRETANLGFVEDGEILLANQVRSREVKRAISPVGGRTPVTVSGMGKAVLASYDPSEIRDIVRQRGMRRVTPNSLASAEALHRDLELIKINGYSVDDEECRAGLRCVAATVYDRQAEVICAISVSGLTTRITSDRIPSLGRLVAQVAANMTAALGGRSPR